MTRIQINLPDELVQRAKREGLLSDSAIQHLLEEAMRREAGRKLMEIAQRVQAAGIPPMTMDEIQAEVDAVRAERRARQNKGGDVGRS